MSASWVDKKPYKGCPIQHRKEVERRGWRVRVPNQLGSVLGTYQVHNSLEACKRNIDRRLRIYGEPTERLTFNHVIGNQLYFK